MIYLLTKLYALITIFRVFLYQKGIFRCHHLKNPVVSIGNLTVGGTGKTPLVIFLAQTLKKAGYQPIILTRGYKRKNKSPVLLVSEGGKILCTPEECGDEAYLLGQTLEEIPIVVSKNRYIGGRSIEDRYQNVVHLLDDGYQHLRLHRDLNILVLDATDPLNKTHLLPFGRLREPLQALQRADTIVISRSHISSDIDLIETQIRRWNQSVPISYFHHDVIGLFDARNSQRQLNPRDFLGKKIAALAAIGNPNVFLHDLAHYQMKVVERFLFRDHHSLTQVELDRVLEPVKQKKVHAVITTEKDAVRLKNLHFEEKQIYVLQIEFQPQDLETYKKNFLEEIKFLCEKNDK